MMNYEDINILEKSVEKKFAVVSFINDPIIDREKIRLINNSRLNLLRLEIDRENDKTNILYDITNKVTIGEYLKDKVLQVSEFSNILLKILSEVKKVEVFDLKGLSLVNSKTVYFDRELESPYIMCLPIKEDGRENLEEISRFIKNIIVDVASIDDRENFISKILNFLREKTFSIDEFERILVKYCESNFLSYEDALNEEDSKKHDEISSENNIVDYSEEVSSKNEDQNEYEVPSENEILNYNTTLNDNKIEAVEKGKNGIKVNPNSPVNTQIIEPSDALNPKTELIGLDNHKNQLVSHENTYFQDIIKAQKNQIKMLNIKFISAILLIQVVAIAAILSALFLLDDDNYVVTATVVALSFGIDLVLSVILNSIRLNKKRQYDVKAANRNTESIRRVTENTTNNIKMAKREIVSEMSYCTQIINNEEYPYLVENKNGVVQKIYINRDVFKIGRVPELVEYVSDNRAVGKIHAEIRKVNSEYYIMDLNSKNGTFINDKKLESNELYKINQNDSIKFANSSYIFRFS